LPATTLLLNCFASHFLTSTVKYIVSSRSVLLMPSALAEGNLFSPHPPMSSTLLFPSEPMKCVYASNLRGKLFLRRCDIPTWLCALAQGFSWSSPLNLQQKRWTVNDCQPAERADEREAYPCSHRSGEELPEKPREMVKRTPALPCSKRLTPITPRFETSETLRVTVTLEEILRLPIKS
jgi:hypothetical protein